MNKLSDTQVKDQAQAEIRQLINAGIHQDILHERLRQLGIGTMIRDGLTKVAQGITTADELFRVCGFSNRNEATSPSPKLVTTS